MTVMPFGKYRGWPVSELPDDYLDWLANVDNLWPRLRAAVDDELEARHGPPVPKAAPPIHPGVLAWRAAWKKLIWHGHPDRGGDEALFKILVGINDAMEGKK